MRAGEVAERAGVNVETLRYYERRGLLPKPDRAPSGHGSYDHETVQLLRAAKIDEIDTRIAALQRMREELARVVGCACDPLDHCTCGAAYLARGGREPSAR